MTLSSVDAHSIIMAPRVSIVIGTSLSSISFATTEMILKIWKATSTIVPQELRLQLGGEGIRSLSQP